MKLKLLLLVLIITAVLCGCSVQTPDDYYSSSSQKEGMEVTFSINCSTILNNMDQLESGLESYVPSDGVILKPTKITLDEPNYAYDYSLTGEIDTQKHTITFPETPTFLSRIVMGTTYNSLVPITYTYTVEGNQLTLYAEGKDEQSHFRVIRLRFNYVGDNH